MGGYRVDRQHDTQVYDGDRLVATFTDAEEARHFVCAMASMAMAWEDGYTNGWNDAVHHGGKKVTNCDTCHWNPYEPEASSSVETWLRTEVAATYDALMQKNEDPRPEPEL